MNAARGMANGFGHHSPKAITKMLGVRTLQDLPVPLRAALEGLLQPIDQLSATIHGYDEAIAGLIERQPEVVRLKTISGVGPLTAMTFVLTLGSAERFAHSRDVASYLGSRPRQKQSGARDPQLGIAKSGDKYLRKLLVQCAHHVLGRFGREEACDCGRGQEAGGLAAPLVGDRRDIQTFSSDGMRLVISRECAANS